MPPACCSSDAADAKDDGRRGATPTFRNDGVAVVAVPLCTYREHARSVAHDRSQRSSDLAEQASNRTEAGGQVIMMPATGRHAEDDAMTVGAAVMYCLPW